MTQTVEEIKSDLKNFIAGRGDSKGLCHDVDYSRWVGMRVIQNDPLALAVFSAMKYAGGESFGYSISFKVNSGENSLNEEEDRDEIDDVDINETISDEFDEDEDLNAELLTDESGFDDDEDDIDLDIQVTEFHKPFDVYERIKHDTTFYETVLQFPFEDYFTGEIEAAKVDIITSWIIGYYPYELYAKILAAYDLSLKDSERYFGLFNKEKNKSLVIPPELPPDPKLAEFRKEFRKLPFSSRLHLLDTQEYYDFTTKNKFQKLHHLSETTLHKTRGAGIDPVESAKILQKSKLIYSFPDGRGYVSPCFQDTVRMVASYADALEPAYREWKSEVFDRIVEICEESNDDFIY